MKFAASKTLVCLFLLSASPSVFAEPNRSPAERGRPVAAGPKDDAEFSRTLKAVQQQLPRSGQNVLSTSDCPSCPTVGSSAPRSSKLDLLAEIRAFRAAADGPALNRENCAAFLKKTYDSVLRADAAAFNEKLTRKNAQTIVDELFTTKIALRHKLGAMEAAAGSSVSPECVRGMRDILRAVLFLSEYVTEHFIPQAVASSKRRVFEGGKPQLMLNPAFGPELQLKSGDVLLSRGDAFVSGAIARIGNDDGNYSHVAMVYVDPVTRKTYVVESHIEVGAVITPIEKYLTDGKVRATVLRQKDPELAHKAAKHIHDRVKKASDSGKNIPYDFGMVLEGKDADGKDASDSLFCSEVAYAGYKAASGGTYRIPRYPTGIDMKNDAFLKAIGVQTKSTFAPSDMEVDSRFELVADWRDFKRTEKSRMTDLILTQTYRYMEERGYKLKESKGDVVKTGFGYGLRRVPLLNKGVKEKFPTNMSRKAIGTIVALDKTAAPMLEQLTKASTEQRKTTGYAFTAPQMAAFLDDLRAKDHAAWKAKRKSLYHESFQPGN